MKNGRNILRQQLLHHNLEKAWKEERTIDFLLSFDYKEKLATTKEEVTSSIGLSEVFAA